MCEICRAAQRGDHAAVLRLARQRRGWTQTELGEHAGFSHSVVSRYETGSRPMRDLVVLRRFAEVLDVPGAVFGLGGVGGLTVCGESTRGADPVLRRELLSGLVGLAGAALLPTPSAGAAPRYRSVAGLRAGLAVTHAQFAACRYHTVGAVLPELITNGHHLLEATPLGVAREQTAAVLADSYSLASFLADKLGDYSLSWVMADRARTHAQASGSSMSLAAATREAAVAMRRAGHHQDAAALLTTTAAALPTTSSQELAGRGCLLVTAAYTAAQQGNAGTALDLAQEAAEVAGRLPSDWPTTAIFTPSQVAIYQVSIHNALGDPARALTVARTISLGPLPTAERRARVCLDVARAWYGYGDAGRCLHALETAERLAPEDVARPSVRTLTRQLLNQPGPTSAALVAFAQRNGAV